MPPLHISLCVQFFFFNSFFMLLLCFFSLFHRGRECAIVSVFHWQTGLHSLFLDLFDKHISMEVIFFHPKSMNSEKKLRTQAVMCNGIKTEKPFIATVKRPKLRQNNTRINWLTWTSNTWNTFAHKHFPALATARSNSATDNDIVILCAH